MGWLAWILLLLAFLFIAIACYCCIIEGARFDRQMKEAWDWYFKKVQENQRK